MVNLKWLDVTDTELINELLSRFDDACFIGRRDINDDYDITWNVSGDEIVCRGLLNYLLAQQSEI